jgi:hypothetical protein
VRFRKRAKTEYAPCPADEIDLGYVLNHDGHPGAVVVIRPLSGGSTQFGLSCSHVLDVRRGGAALVAIQSA